MKAGNIYLERWDVTVANLGSWRLAVMAGARVNERERKRNGKRSQKKRHRLAVCVPGKDTSAIRLMEPAIPGSNNSVIASAATSHINTVSFETNECLHGGGSDNGVIIIITTVIIFLL